MVTITKLLKLIYRFNTISIRTPPDFFITRRIDKLTLKFIKNVKQFSQTLKKKVTDFKTWTICFKMHKVM